MGFVRLQGGFGFDFEAAVKSASHFFGIEKCTSSDAVEWQIPTGLPFAECPQSGAGFLAGKDCRNRFSGTE